METKGKKIQKFFIDTLNGMAHGLFATLIIGTIFSSIGQLFLLGKGNAFCDFMFNIIGSGKVGISYILQCLTGAGIGIGIALALKFSPLKTIALAAVGEISAYFSLTTRYVDDGNISYKFQIGDPLTIYIVCILTALLMMLVLKKKTSIDILLIPLFTITVGSIFAYLIRYPAIYVTFGVQWLINISTEAIPFVMGIVVSVLMGMALTAPISSAAIAAMIFTFSNGETNTGLAIASGAAIVGCCTQMVGFAIQSRKDNPLGIVISIGLGTSMLQFKNILKKPVVWLPTIMVSAILGPISTCFLKLVCEGASAGMGTAGLVGIIGIISSMGYNSWQAWVGIASLCIIGPILLTWLIDIIFRKLGWIKKGDLTV